MGRGPCADQVRAWRIIESIKAERLYSERLTAIGLVCWRGGALRAPLAV